MVPHRPRASESHARASTVSKSAQLLEGPEGTALDPEAALRAERAKRSLRLRLRVVGVVLVCAIGFLIYKTLSSAVTYFKTVDQAIAARSTLGTSTFQLEGLVVPGSIHRPSPTTVDFVVAGSHGARIDVVDSATPPELFQANIPVVLVGHFASIGNRFFSDQILVKHSNSYIAAHPSRVRAPNGSIR